ncbi:hypothetical protein [Paenibacillus sp. FSL F4-0243]|uniref:hypothetical protein n=1 Tax=Paenibacillus sp. FSL F4-0243 TaxID=2954732 RepID=UPI0030DC9CC9
MTNELIDRNESPVKVGDQVEVRLPTYIGHIVCSGPVEYRKEDVGCYGPVTALTIRREDLKNDNFTAVCPSSDSINPATRGPHQIIKGVGVSLLSQRHSRRILRHKKR